MTKRILFIIAVTAIAILGFSLLPKATADAHSHDDEAEVDTSNIGVTLQQMKVADIKLGQVSRKTMGTAIAVNGQLVLRPQDIADISSLMGGVVRHLLVKDGQEVKQGQVVATIENTEIVSLQREYFAALRQSQFARLDMERQMTLRKNGAGVERNLQQTERDYHVSQATLTGIERQLQQMGIDPKQVACGQFTSTFSVHSPINGTVSRITASLGSYVDMQSPLMQIRNNRAIECDVNVFEKDLGKIKVGQHVDLTVTNQPGTHVSGTVYGMNRYFSNGAKTVAVHVRLKEVNHPSLIEGMYVAGSILVGRNETETLPSTAIVKADGKNYIFALNGRRSDGYSFSRHEVTTGTTMDGDTQVELCEHIKKGQKIVTGNAHYLASMTGEHGEH